MDFSKSKSWFYQLTAKFKRLSYLLEFILVIFFDFFVWSRNGFTRAMYDFFYSIFILCSSFNLLFVWIHNAKVSFFSVVFTVAAIASCVLGQYQYSNNIFNGCDYFETIELGRIYDVFSPYYPEKYPPGTNCRWSGCSPSGTNIVIKCTDLKIPTVIVCK